MVKVFFVSRFLHNTDELEMNWNLMIDTTTENLNFQLQYRFIKIFTSTIELNVKNNFQIIYYLLKNLSLLELLLYIYMIYK